jgi:hypothetical protein
MGKNEFQKYIDSVSKIEKNEIDWNKEKEDWLKYIDEFYKNIETWLEEYKKKDQIKTIYSNKEIIEENIGRYYAKVLEVMINNKKLYFDPIGTLLVGAKGRIDLKGPKGKILFVLVDKNYVGPKIETHIFHSEEERVEFEKKQTEIKKTPIEWTWKIATQPPHIKYFDVDENSFFDSIMEILNG